MNLTGGIVLFAVIWFIVFFVALQIRPGTQDEAGDIVPGTPPGAPADFRLGRKALITTGITVVLWSAIAWTILSGAIGIRDLDWFGRLDPQPATSTQP
jgi:predicted secreted protein